jgi:formamidopyrimidine-DNA glycosylase
VSIELPEAHILATQMNQELGSKRIKACSLHQYRQLQKMGLVNQRIRDFLELRGTRVERVVARGNTIRIQLNPGMNLVIAPEYGGRVLFHNRASELREKVHLKVAFDDGTLMTVRLTSIGVIHAVADRDLDRNCMMQRDFSATPTPLDKELTLRRFRELMAAKNTALKAALVGKDAVVVGLSNSAFQDILYRAGLHPKRKASQLDREQVGRLYRAIRALVKERLKLGGKDQFVDLFGRPGRYTPAMGPDLKGQCCGRCKSAIARIAHGGGHVYLCPTCQV